MTRIPPPVTRVYALLLRLYPRAFRDEFGDEMQTVFADAVQEAMRTGPLALARLCWREWRELLVNSALEHWARFQKGRLAMNPSAPAAERPLSWRETLMGLFPFFLFGPLHIWLTYPYPYPAESVSGWFEAVQIQLFVLCLLFGLVAGAATGWRRWSFPYVGMGLWMVGAWILSQCNRWLYAAVPRRELGLHEQLLFMAGGFALILGVFALALLVGFLLTRVVGALQMLYARIRQDWTQLSFGLYIAAAFILGGGIEHEEDPTLTILVILPGVTVLLSALAYLRSTTRSRRLGSLVLGLALGLALSIARHGFYIVFGVILVPIIFFPALFELWPRQNRPIPTE